MSLNEAIREVTEKTASQFHEDMAALGCLEPTHEPRATEFVLPREDGKTDMETMIQILIDKGHAYVAKGEKGREVLFRVASMKDYGALSNRKLDEQQAGARVAVESHKENAGDFVLWKESTAEEPGWDGTFSDETIRGRPGWHIECSAMAEAYLGQTFDIHGGGLDLIFPHHENEIAQSRCVHGTDAMANVWMHNGFLQVEGQKMSKSDGNFHTVHDVLHTDKVGGRRWPGEVVRLAMLMTHYREPIDFSVKRLEEAENELAQISGSQDFLVIMRESNVDFPEPSLSQSMVHHLSNDLNSSEVLTHIRSLRKLAERGTNTQKTDRYAQLAVDLEFLGINAIGFAERFHDEQNAKKIGLSRQEKKVDAEINARLAYIAEKNWLEADRIRGELLEQGIQLKDSKDPQTGDRITTWEVKR